MPISQFWAIPNSIPRLFDDVVSSPLPRRVADLMRRVKSDETNAREGTEHEDRGNR
jgi:hypothetical protein